MKNDETGSIYRTPALATKYNGNYAVIGDYYFTNYDHYQSKLTELSEIWIGDYLSKRKR